jgi:hypothetical protein
MRTPMAIVCLLAAVILVCGCSKEQITTPDPGTEPVSSGIAHESIAYQLIMQAGWSTSEDEVVTSNEIRIMQSNPHYDVEFLGREILIGDIAHYKWHVQVGPNPYDVIGLHRVVRESEPNSPIQTLDNICMLHGDLKDFEGCFIPGLLSPGNPDEFGIAVHLALEDVDVWGIDQPWCLVPEEETDLSFMATWGMDRHIADTRTGLAVARLVRRMTGNGYNKMTLLGFSGGAALGFAYVCEETTRPYGHRHVGTFIPADQGMQTDNSDWRASSCGTVAYYEDLMANGEYAEVNALPLFGIPARDDPDGASELIPGFTNFQAVLALAVYPYIDGFPGHFLAGTFDDDEKPNGLQYSDVSLWIDFACNAPPYMPNLWSRDEYSLACDGPASPWAGHLGDVEIPVLYLSAGGGFGPEEEYTLELMGSSDITVLEIRLHPPEDAWLDFAHIDLFTGEDADELVWDPCLAWIQGHRHPGNGRHRNSHN